MDNNRRNNKSSTAFRVWSVIICVLSGIFLAVGVGVIRLSAWYDEHYEMSFKELLYTLLAPLEGTGDGMISEIVGEVLPAVIGAFIVYWVFIVLVLSFKRRYMPIFGLIVSFAILLNAGIYAWEAFKIGEYVLLKDESTHIYEEMYVDPDTVSITSDDEKRNLIYIYLESMEIAYASKEVGGWQEENYMPYLTQLAMENISFSDNEEGMLGGFKAPNGTGWTIAALLGLTCGVPFAFPVWHNNAMDEREAFASGITGLGDILEREGYAQAFLCGSDVAFGGREKLFTDHGGYALYDLYTARAEGYIDEDYYVWWGYEDKYLYDIAKDKITEMAAGSQPFNFSMLTVDTHSIGGYVCSECREEYENATANVVSCSDRQVYEFVQWCMEQDFYENTVIVIVGDHPRHDQELVGDICFEERSIYNCFINSAAQVRGSANNRVFTTLDMFPTVLAAMGFSIEGDRLGLGVNMFSKEITISEQMGYLDFNSEISKYSEYYIMNFS